MRRRNRDLEPELEAFLAHRPVERHLSPEARARALARARSIVAGGGALPPGPLRELPTPAPLPRARRRRVVVCAALAGSVALAAGFLTQVLVASRGAAPPRRPAESPEVTPVVQRPASPPPATEAAPDQPSRPEPPRAARTRPRREVPGPELFAVELELLQRAQTAYTRRDYAGALELLADHARLFPRGSLAEEREALRVRSLLGLGRTAEAHRQGAAFARRFPYSVLLPRLDDRESALE